VNQNLEEETTVEADAPVKPANPKAHYNQQFVFDSPVTSAPAAKQPKAPKYTAKVLALTVAAAIIGGAVVGGATGAVMGVLFSSDKTVIVNNQASVNWVTAAAAKASPSVVTIAVVSAQASGSGSGVVLSEDGYILTNTHVVTMEGATANPTIEVKLNNDVVYDAEIIGTDPTNDLAVLKIEPVAKLTPIEWSDSELLNVGDYAVALGAPLGLEKTVTLGIVSALNRTIQVANSAAPQGQDGLQLWNGNSNALPINITVIQTDAAINPGNSGGALVDQNGKLIGINVAIASAGSGSTAGSIGVGFAIPSTTAQRIAEEIIATGKASHAMLGANIQDAGNAEGGFSKGAEIMQIRPGTAAEKAGLQVGDVVVKFNDRDIANASELTAAVRQQPAGAEASITVLRGNETLIIEVKLGDAADINK